MKPITSTVAEHLTPAGVQFILLKRAEKLEREAATLRRLAKIEAKRG